LKSIEPKCISNAWGNLQPSIQKGFQSFNLVGPDVPPTTHRTSCRSRLIYRHNASKNTRTIAAMKKKPQMIFTALGIEQTELIHDN
jgi:hypothetical protein